MFSILLLAFLSINAVYCDGKNWALLVAGSNGYYNYRHQADICHAYQIMHNHGIPDENIVVMMYDDIAENRENPTKGQIINKPDGPDVYKGVLKDYIKTSVNPNTFLNVLAGKSELVKDLGSGKVIDSGPDDNVFVFFADHGAPGLIAFPNNKALHASDLNKTLYEMYQNNRYKHMVIYVEACESGSMFDNLLPPNIRIYATTAANPSESSYACYYDEKRRTYLGDVYSVMWMEDSDAEDLSQETLSKQFQIVKKETNTSHVMEYGNLTMANTYTLSQFQGNATPSSYADKPNYAAILDGAVPSEDVRLNILRKKYEAESDPLKKSLLLIELENLTKSYRQVVSMMKEIPSMIYANNANMVHDILGGRKKLTNHECYTQVVDHLIGSCFTLENEYFLKTLYVLVNLCESGVTPASIIEAAEKLCTQRN